MPIVGVPGDDAMGSPGGKRVFVDAKALGCFRSGQHSPVPQAVAAGLQVVLVHQAGDAGSREAGVLAAATGGFARTV